MRKLYNYMTITAVAVLMTACAGTPVSLGTRGEMPNGAERTVTARACGFQLFIFIPININDRMERANKELERQAAGDYITDVKVRESWSYAFVGTSYCTSLQAKAIQSK